MKTSSAYDWTAGPAKWAAVVVLGGASLAGMGWSIFGREPRVELAGRPVAPAAPVTMAPAGPERRPGLPRPDSGAPEEEAAGLLDLNTASAAQLELLPSIGPSLARRIVEYRGANGKFGSVSDLDKVSGIGPLTLEKVRPLVTVK